MTMKQANDLVVQAVRLTVLGYRLERKRKRISTEFHKLNQKKNAAASPGFLKRFDSFNRLNDRWTQLEREHLAYRDSFVK